MSAPPQQELAAPADAISAVRFAPDQSSRLLVASWDRHVYLYDSPASGAALLRKIEHRAPVLDVCFGEDGNTAYSAGVDWNVSRLDLASGDLTTMSTHKAGIRSVIYSKEHNIMISASWDLSLHVHHISSGEKAHVTRIELPNKPFSISASTTKLVVAMAARQLSIYELASLAAVGEEVIEPWQRRESSLKFMTRAVASMPTDLGYASSSIEGRVAVEWFDPSTESQSRKYAFKCHRQTSAEGVDVVYPVNALAFHPVHGTFASGGGDGIVALWDATAKRRIRQYQKYPSSIAALDFTSDGNYLAIAVSPGFEDGKEAFGDGDIRIYVRQLGETEAKGKSAK